MLRDRELVGEGSCLLSVDLPGRGDIAGGNEPIALQKTIRRLGAAVSLACDEAIVEDEKTCAID